MKMKPELERIEALLDQAQEQLMQLADRVAEEHSELEDAQREGAEGEALDDLHSRLQEIADSVESGMSEVGQLIVDEGE